MNELCKHSLNKYRGYCASLAHDIVFRCDCVHLVNVTRHYMLAPVPHALPGYILVDQASQFDIPVMASQANTVPHS